MPLKKKTRPSASTAKGKRNFAFKDNTSRTVGQKTKPLVSALKENNRCLAAALDESRHEYRVLQDNFLKLQQERQKLLEKVASLENQLVKQDHKDVQPSAIHMQPTLQLLDQAEKDINCARNYLKQLFSWDPITTTSVQYGGFPPYCISPIQDYCCTKTQGNGDNIKHSETSSRAKIASEAEGYSCDKVKAVYPKTPHPGSLKSPQLSSTPCVESKSTQSPILVCSPKAINFEESSQTSGDVSDARKLIEPKLNGSRKAKTSPTEGSRAGTVEHDTDVIVSPGLPKDEDLRDEDEDTPKPIDLPTELNTTDRPRRRCTSLNISYQEPSLNRKLRRGDPFTSENTGCHRSEKTKYKTQRNIKKTARATLKDLTNKK